MAAQTLEQDLLALEKRYWQAMKTKDAGIMASLTDFPCLIAGAQGVASVDEQHLSKMMSAATWTLERFELSEPQVRKISDDLAVIAYKVHEELTVDGKPVSLDAADTSVWVRRDGRWLCAAHTEALLGDPYGRDRTRAGS